MSPTPAAGATTGGETVAAVSDPGASQQLRRVADGGREPDPLERPPGDGASPLEDREQVPAPVVPGEGVDLVDDDRAQPGEQPRWSTQRRDEHGLQRLGRGQQQVRRLAAGSPSLAGPTSPCQARRAAEPDRRTTEPRLQVVEQRPERADVQHGQAGQCSSSIRERSGKHAASVFPPAVGASSRLVAARTGSMASLLEWAQGGQPRELTMWCCSTGWSRSQGAPSRLARSSGTGRSRCPPALTPRGPSRSTR